MITRLATTRDLSRLTDITLSSLQDDPAFDYMWPHRFRYPDDNSFFWGIHLKEMLYDPSMVFLVVELDDSDTDDEKKQVPRTVISYGIWERIGSDRAAKKRARAKNTLVNLLNALTARFERKLIAVKYTRRDSSQARLAALDAATEEARRKYFEGAGIASWWSMELLVTDRAYRRRGAASQLVEWGCSSADKEGLWSGVEASAMGEPLYDRAGFEKKAAKTVKLDGEDEGLTYAIMMRPPRANEPMKV